MLAALRSSARDTLFIAGITTAAARARMATVMHISTRLKPRAAPGRSRLLALGLIPVTDVIAAACHRVRAITHQVEAAWVVLARENIDVVVAPRVFGQGRHERFLVVLRRHEGV